MAAAIRLVPIGSEAPRAYPLVKDQITIGAAADNDIVLTDGSVSRRHALIFRRLGGLRVRDLESTNGIRINGRRVSGSRRLRPGDELEVGAVRFAVMSPTRGPGIAARTIVVAAVALMVLGFAAAELLRVRGAGFFPSKAPPVSSAVAPGFPPVPSAPVAAADGASAARRPVSATDAEVNPGAKPVPEVGKTSGWLKTLNHYRALSGLEPVHEDTPLSAGGFAHARYLVKNSSALIKAGMLGPAMHTEEPARPWYSVEGLRAGRSGDVEQWWGPTPGSRPPSGWAIDEWIASTWHRMWILNPRLREVGYGEYCENGTCVAVLDVLSRLSRGGFAPAAAPAPVQFPPDGAAMRMNDLGAEWPDPLSSCDGYSAPAGLPITLQLGSMIPARLSAYSLTRGADRQTLEACGFDASSYVNSSSADQSRAREIMSELGAVVVIPRGPLASGEYTVEMTVNGRSYTWQFSVTPR